MTMLALRWGCFFLPAFLGTGMIPFCAHGAAWHQAVWSYDRARASLDGHSYGLPNERGGGEKRVGGGGRENVHKFGWMQRQPKGSVLSHETLDPFLGIGWMETSEYWVHPKYACSFTYTWTEHERGVHTCMKWWMEFSDVWESKVAGQVSRTLLEVLVPEFNHCLNIVLSFGDLRPKNDHDFKSTSWANPDTRLFPYRRVGVGVGGGGRRCLRWQPAPHWGAVINPRSHQSAAAVSSRWQRTWSEVYWSADVVKAWK